VHERSAASSLEYDELDQENSANSKSSVHASPIRQTTMIASPLSG
jgi:hypothetical protein